MIAVKPENRPRTCREVSAELHLMTARSLRSGVGAICAPAVRTFQNQFKRWTETHLKHLLIRPVASKDSYDLLRVELQRLRKLVADHRDAPDGLLGPLRSVCDRADEYIIRIDVHVEALATELRESGAISADARRRAEAGFDGECQRLTAHVDAQHGLVEAWAAPR